MLQLLKDTEESLSAISVGDGGQKKEKSRQCLASFHTTAAMFGLEDLAKAGIELEKFLTDNVSSNTVDSIAALGFAVSSLVDQMRSSRNGKRKKSKINLSEILDILGLPDDATPALCEDEVPVEPGPKGSGAPDATRGTIVSVEENAGFQKLQELVRDWGGDFTVSCDSPSKCKFRLTFTGSPESLKKVEELLCSENSTSLLSPEEAKVEKLLDKGREFMDAFSSGDIPHAQDILLDLADQQPQSSILYKEVGTLARGLHESIRNFLNNLEPSLKDMVEDQLPDSGNRLDHMLKMTEKSAITTLDHVEAMQERLAIETELISNLREVVGGLSAIGAPAEKKLEQGNEALDALESIIGQHRSDLDIILTAQDYQDLSGQIILKTTQLLNDIQIKLVHLIKTFGVKVDTKDTPRPKTTDTLYGPAHAGVEDAVQSQDEVDSLLAEFGF
jgi:chemotaxis protein CheZ